MVGQAFLLDGIDAYVDVGNASSLQVSSGDFTVDAWVKFNALSHPPGVNTGGAPPGDMSIIDKMANTDTPNLDGWRLLKINDDRFIFCLGGGTNNGCDFGVDTTVFSSTHAITGVWYHLAAVKSSTEIAIYVNGVKEDSKHMSGFTDSNSANLLIGANAREGAHLNGLVDEVEIFNRALTASEIAAIAKADSRGKCRTCTPPPSGMTGWWPGDGNPNDIIRSRNAVLRDNATTGAGLVGDGFVLDGNGDFVEVSDNPALNVGTGDFTVDLWVNFNTTEGEQVLVEKWIQRFDDPYASEGWTLTKLGGNVLLLAMRDGSGPEIDVATDVLSIATGTWNHFAATRQGNCITLYMNEVPVAENTSSLNSLNLNSASSLKFGHRGTVSDTPGSEQSDGEGNFLNGQIDEVELFVGRALSASETQAILNAGSAGKCKLLYFSGFFQPVDNNVPNSAKAGQIIPIKWRLTDANGVPISDPSSFVSVTSSATSSACSGLADAIETYAGSSGLQYLSNGYWQFNWKTPKAYAGQCRTMSLNLKDGASGRTAAFVFK